MSKEMETNNDKTFFTEISGLLQQARTTAYKAVNTVMVQTYWQIGRRIVEQEQQGQTRAGYGDFLITNLSRYLSDSFGKGFSEANLSWTNIRLIMRLDDPKERAYYLKEASSQNWSSRLLERNIKSGFYHRLLSTQQKYIRFRNRNIPSFRFY